jgi:hypothetical protein
MGKVKKITKDTHAVPPTINKMYADNLYRIIKEKFVDESTGVIQEEAKHLFVIGVYLENLENYILELEQKLAQYEKKNVK